MSWNQETFLKDAQSKKHGVGCPGKKREELARKKLVKFTVTIKGTRKTQESMFESL